MRLNFWYQQIKKSNHFLDMCLTSGADGSTALCVLTTIDEVLVRT